MSSNKDKVTQTVQVVEDEEGSKLRVTNKWDGGFESTEFTLKVVIANKNVPLKVLPFNKE